MAQVLFIQLSRLGDCVQSTPLLASWRERFPDDAIVVLTLPENAPVFQGNPSVDELLAYTPPTSLLLNESIDPLCRLQELSGWLNALKSRHFRVVINLTHNALSSWLATALEPAETRGLYMDRSGRMRTGDPWGHYSFSLLKYRRANILNIVDSYAHLSGGASLLGAPIFTLRPEDIRSAAAWLEDDRPGRRVVGFQPGASRIERRWPVENFITVGRQLVADYDARILVFGSKTESSLAAAIAASVPGAVSFAGRTTIPQLAALLAHCRVLVTNDTGTMHVASAVGARIVALFESSAYFRETGPYGSGHWIIQSPEVLEYGERTEDELSRIRRIPPGEVVWAVRSLLAERTDDEPGPPADAPRELQALHFRSVWEGGHLDFQPVGPADAGAELVAAYVQRPVWLATLGDGDLPLEETMTGVRAILQGRYSIPVEALEAAALELHGDSERALHELRRMKRILRSGLEKLRRNPGHLIPQHETDLLTELERRILELQSRPALQAFLGYFETALAMVSGDNTRGYIESYLRPVTLLERQLVLFTRLLSAIAGRKPH